MKVEVIVNRRLCRIVGYSIGWNAAATGLAYLLHLLLTLAFSGPIVFSSLFGLAVAVGVWWRYDEGLIEPVANEDRYETWLARELHERRSKQPDGKR